MKYIATGTLAKFIYDNNDRHYMHVGGGEYTAEKHSCAGKDIYSFYGPNTPYPGMPKEDRANCKKYKNEIRVYNACFTRAKKIQKEYDSKDSFIEMMRNLRNSFYSDMKSLNLDLNEALDLLKEGKFDDGFKKNKVEIDVCDRYDFGPWTRQKMNKIHLLNEVDFFLIVS